MQYAQGAPLYSLHALELAHCFGQKVGGIMLRLMRKLGIYSVRCVLLFCLLVYCFIFHCHNPLWGIEGYFSDDDPGSHQFSSLVAGAQNSDFVQPSIETKLFSLRIVGDANLRCFELQHRRSALL